MLSHRRPGRFARLAIAYDSWLLAQTRRRWAKHDRAVMMVPGWAHAEVAAMVHDLNTRRAGQHEAARAIPGPLATQAREQWLARNPNYARRLTDPLLRGEDGAPGG